MADLAAKHGKGDALLDVAVAVDGRRNGPSNALPCTGYAGSETAAALVSATGMLSMHDRDALSVR